MKKLLFSMFLILCIIFLGSKIFNTSFAYSYDIDKSVLFYKEDYLELEKDIEKYIDNIDDILIPNSSYLFSDKLSYNYDFLVHFALDYILDNREYYNKNIKKLDKCLYFDKDGESKSTLDYIDLDIIYDITDFYFDIRDFSVINDNVCISSNYISLTDYTYNYFDFKIVNIEIGGNNKNIEALILYNNGNKYLYSFDVVHNILKIKNVEVVL